MSECSREGLQVEAGQEESTSLEAQGHLLRTVGGKDTNFRSVFPSSVSVIQGKLQRPGSKYPCWYLDGLQLCGQRVMLTLSPQESGEVQL